MLYISCCLFLAFAQHGSGVAVSTPRLALISPHPCARSNACAVHANAAGAAEQPPAIDPPSPSSPPASTDGVGDADITEMRKKLSDAARSGDWEKALSLLDALCAAAEANGFAWPHPRSFDDAIIACSRAEPTARWSEAQAVLGMMSARGLQPRSYAFNGCIVACARAGQSGEALKLLNQMKASGVAPDLVSFNSALLGLQREKSTTARMTGWQTALQLLTQMRDRDITPDGVSYGNAICACRRAWPLAQASQAVKLVEEMKGKGLEPAEATLIEALSACADAGSHEVEAARLWQSLQSLGVPPSKKAYHARLYERGTAKDWQGALALLEEMKNAGQPPDASCIGHAGRACARAGAWRAATDLLRRCEADYGVKPGERLYRSTIQACGRAGEWQAALALLDEALGRAETGGGDEAASEGEIPPPVGSAGGGKPPCAPSIGLFSSAMAALSVSGEWKQCLTLLDRMAEDGVQGDIPLYGHVLHSLQSAGNWEGVYELLYTMRAEGVTTAETQLPYHVTLWKRAKRELGLFPS